MISTPNHPHRIGWREWLALPELGIQKIKAKVDTGAHTSALHAFTLRKFKDNGKWRVEFGIHPRQRDNTFEQFCIADIVDERRVTDSGGHSEMRLVIHTAVTLGQTTWPIEITLTNRDNMQFRMLLGRNALRDKWLIDTSASYIMGKPHTTYNQDSNASGAPS